MFQLSKRQKFFIATVIVVAVLFFLRLSPWLLGLQWRFKVIIFSFISLITTIWSVYDEDFSGVEWLTIPILPLFLTVGATLVYPLLPKEVPQLLFWTLDTDTGLFLAGFLKVVYILSMGIAFYASLLTGNIFNVAALRTIQLLRVAHSMDFILSLLALFLWKIAIFSLHLQSFMILLASFIVSFALALQSVWSINLEPNIKREVWLFSLAIALVLSEFAFALSFWPISGFIFALFQTVCFYEMVGVVHYFLIERIHRVDINEILIIGTTLLLLLFFTTSWTG